MSVLLLDRSAIEKLFRVRRRRAIQLMSALGGGYLVGKTFLIERLQLIEPVGYVEFLSLVSGAAGVLTDSGGIQEETTYLGLPCFTLRANTERPITVSMGTNVLLGLAPERISEVPALLEAARGKQASIPPLWDGGAAERIVDVLARYPLEELVVAETR